LRGPGLDMGKSHEGLLHEVLQATRNSLAPDNHSKAYSSTWVYRLERAGTLAE
jgi:hypothetical protein